MRNSMTWRGVCLCASFLFGSAVVWSQPPACEDEVISAMRGRTEIGASDQRRIADWVERQVAGFADLKAFRECFRSQYDNPNNSADFRTELSAQTAAVAELQFARPDVDPALSHALARVLVDMGRPETINALLGGLKAKNSAARYLSARGLVAQRNAIAADRERLERVVDALRNAGLAETSAAVLGRIYEALAYPNQVQAVFDAYLAIFDVRLKRRREGAMLEEGAERYAFEYFRTPGILESLEAEQKQQLVGRVAVFLRQAAERYNTPDLTFDEIDKIERVLDGAEAIVARLAGPSDAGGKVREALSAGGYTNRAAVVQEAYRWVGDPDTNTSGVLNEAPWNVPLGAP